MMGLSRVMMNIHKIFVVGFFSFVIAPAVYCQNLNGLMEAGEVKLSEKINREPDKALLIVTSQIPKLKFDSNRIIDKVTQDSSGRAEVWLPSGTHILKISAVGYERLDLSPMSFEKRKVYEIRIRELKPPRFQNSVGGNGSISILTEPAGATVLVEGMPGSVWTTPATIEKIRATKWKLTIIKEKYDTLFKEIFVDQDTLTQHGPFRLAPRFGFIRFSNLQGSTIDIDGKSWGSTEIAEVNIGERLVTIRNSNWGERKKKFRIASGETKTISPEDFQDPGVILVGTDVPADILVNGRSIGRGSIRYSTFPGTYSIQIHHPSLGEINESVVLQPKQELKIFRSLLPLKEKALWLLAIPGASQICKNETTKGVIHAGLFVGSCAAFLYFNQDYENRNSEYASTITKYNNASTAVDAAHYKELYTGQYDKLHTVSQIKDVAMISLAVVYVWNIVDALIFAPEFGYRSAATKDIGFHIDPVNKNMEVIYSIRH